MNTDTYYSMYSNIWIELPELNAGLPKPAKTLGRKLCGHDSTTPPLDFRSYPESSV